eukprot:COSAG02_NODE_2791_length_8022_cov_5.437208_5_plen_151_part_00
MQTAPHHGQPILGREQTRALRGCSTAKAGAISSPDLGVETWHLRGARERATHSAAGLLGDVLAALLCMSSSSSISRCATLTVIILYRSQQAAPPRAQLGLDPDRKALALQQCRQVRYGYARAYYYNVAHNAISDTKWTNFEFGEKRLKNG